MKKHLILVLVALAGVMVMVAGCTSSSNTSPSPANSTVTSTASTSTASTSTASQNSVAIQNYAFNPSTLTIQKEANVTSKNDDWSSIRLFRNVIVPKKWVAISIQM
jgi:uncharacterized lipoprotein YbaY